MAPEGYRLVVSHLQHSGKHVCEERYPDGTLDVKRHDAPFREGDLDKIAKYYYGENPKVESASWQEIEVWYNSKGWYLRPKTW